MSSYLDSGRSFDPLDPELAANPWPVYEDMRDRCPVLRSDAHGGFVAVTRYEDVVAVALDWHTFSSAQGVLPVPFEHDDFRLLPVESDPPYHRGLRRLLNPFFTRAAVRNYEDKMRALTVELIDGFVARGECEFVSEFAALLPGRVVYEGVLGAPREELETILHWVHRLMADPENSAAVSREYSEWTETVLRQREAEDKRNDVIDCLLHGDINGEAVSPEERVKILNNLIIGALDTTENALANIALHLASDPALVERLAAGGDVVERAVDEFLRFETPAPALARTCVADAEIAGEPVKAGERVVVYFGAANRDPRHFTTADDLDFDRPKNDHVAFGWGIHDCLGRHVARSEIRIAIEEMLRRMPNLRLKPGAEVKYRVAMSRSPIELHLEFDAPTES